jgi:histidinol-phosphate aminotransferase
MAKSPRDIVREDVQALAAYHVPDSAGLIKLDAMENPYALPADMQAEVGRLAARAALNRYPDPGARALRQRLKEAMQVPAGMEVLLGNGSDELIQVLALATNRPGSVLMSVEPSFVMYRMVATFAGMRYVGVPLDERFGLDAQALDAAIDAQRPALVFLAYPNNPTGNLFDAQIIRRVVERTPGLVVVDEAYHAFAGRSFLPDLARYPNLLVMRTLSKLGLAGLRLGMLIGTPDWLAELDKLRLPYNVNVLTQQVAHYALGRSDILTAQAAAIRSERERLAARLSACAGVVVYPSDANFILFRVRQAASVFAGLKARGVLIKKLHGSHPRLVDCLRVTVGTPEENEQFLAALQEVLPQAA